MFDARDAFAGQFTQIDGGYVYYPRQKAGGKFVSNEEYDLLLTDWQRISEGRGRWKNVGFIMGSILTWTIVADLFSLPEWVGWMVITAVTSCILAKYFWVSLAPRRLVRDRPDITPPRTALEARQESRQHLKWGYIFSVLGFSGVMLFVATSSRPETIFQWIWIIISGVVCTIYIGVAVRKFLDLQR